MGTFFQLKVPNVTTRKINLISILCNRLRQTRTTTIPSRPQNHVNTSSCVKHTYAEATTSLAREESSRLVYDSVCTRVYTAWKTHLKMRKRSSRSRCEIRGRPMTPEQLSYMNSASRYSIIYKMRRLRDPLESGGDSFFFWLRVEDK